jgi:hypothetical protein
MVLVAQEYNDFAQAREAVNIFLSVALLLGGSGV